MFTTQLRIGTYVLWLNVYVITFFPRYKLMEEYFPWFDLDPLDDLAAKTATEGMNGDKIVWYVYVHVDLVHLYYRG